MNIQQSLYFKAQYHVYNIGYTLTDRHPTKYHHFHDCIHHQTAWNAIHVAQNEPSHRYNYLDISILVLI